MSDRAQRYLEQLVGSIERLHPDAPDSEFDGLLNAGHIAISALEAADVLTAEEAIAWKRKFASIRQSRRKPS